MLSEGRGDVWERNLNPDGTIDRKILGRIVFDQPEKLQKLNAIVHPAVNEKIREEMQKAQEEGKEPFYSGSRTPYGTGIS